MSIFIISTYLSVRNNNLKSKWGKLTCKKILVVLLHLESFNDGGWHCNSYKFSDISKSFSYTFYHPLCFQMQVATGRYHTLLAHDSSVYSCGSSLCGVLGHGPDTTQCAAFSRVSFPSLSHVISISASHNHAAFITELGEVIDALQWKLIIPIVVLLFPLCLAPITNLV
jgi:hypothetical protein